MSDEPSLSTRRSVLTAVGSITAIGLAGCLSSNGFDPEELTVAEFEVLDRALDPHEESAYIHGDHWHGGLPDVHHGEYVSLGAAVEDDDGEPVELGGDLSVDASVVEGAQEGIVSVDSHGDHLHLHGESIGFTEVVFELTHDGEVVWEAPEPLSVRVVDDHDHDHDDHDDHDHDHDDHDDHDHDDHHYHVDELTIFDRAPDPHEEVATFHDDHWDGELPEITAGENVSLGGEFRDEDGHEIAIGHDEEHELGVTLAADAEDGIVTIDSEDDFHGDHVHIHGDEPGTTEVVFSLWHDDHADWESEPIEITVVDAE